MKYITAVFWIFLGYMAFYAFLARFENPFYKALLVTIGVIALLNAHLEIGHRK